MSQWKYLYFFMEYARTWAGGPVRRSWTINWLVLFLDFKMIRCIFPWNNSTYIVRRNCRLGGFLGVFHKYSGLRPSDTLSSCRLGWHRHARTAKQLFVKSYDLSFQSITLVISTYVCLYWIKGIPCYAIRSGRHPSGSQCKHKGRDTNVYYIYESREQTFVQNNTSLTCWLKAIYQVFQKCSS